MSEFQVSIRVEVGDGTEIVVSVDAGMMGNRYFVHQQFTDAAIKATSQIEEMLVARYGKLQANDTLPHPGSRSHSKTRGD